MFLCQFCTGPLPDLHLHTSCRSQERGARLPWAVRAQAGTLLQPGINYPGCREDTRINIYMGIVISASHSEDLISRAPHPSPVIPAVAGQRRGR